MSERRDKAARRLQARAAEQIGRDVVHALVRPRPRWVPRFLWRRLVRLVLRLDRPT